MKTRLLKSGFFAVVILMASLFVTNMSFGQIVARTTTTATNPNGSGNNTITIAKPGGLAVGDVMIAHIYVSENNGTVDVDATGVVAGWVEIIGSIGNNNNDYRVTVLYKIATAADVAAANFVFNIDNGIDDAEGAIMAFGGVSTTGGVTETGAAGGPFDITPLTAFQNIATDNQLNANSITTVTPNAAIIMMGIVNDDNTFTTTGAGSWAATDPATLTELYDVPLNVDNLDISIGGAWAIRTTAGATGGGTVTISGSDPNSAIFIALRCGPTITTTGVADPLCFSASAQSTSLPYTATTGAPTSYSIDWNAAANSAGLADQGSTAHAFVAGAGSMTGISIPASLPAATYSGTLTLSNAGGCISTRSISVTINSGPIANTNGGTGIACPLVPFQITGVTATGTTIQWITSGTGTFTNGNTANPIYTPSAADAGAFLTLTVIVNSDPCPNTFDFYFLTVNNVPADPSNPTSNSPQCASILGVPNGVTVTRGTPPAGVTWYWQTSATGTSTANSSLTFNATTSGTVFLRAQDNTTLCWSTGAGSVAVTVVANAAQPSAITGTNAPCANVAGLTYSVTNVAGLTYSWTVPTGWTITGGQGNNSITVTSGAEGQNGNISVVAISTDGTNQCTASPASNLAVTAANTNNIGFNGNIATNVLEICAGTTGNTINGGNPTGTETFAWQVSTDDPVLGPYISVLPDPGNSTNFTISSSYFNIAGTYYFRRVITASAICNSISDVVTLIVHDPATANAGTNQSVCGGGTIDLSGSIGGGATSATWSAPSGSFGDATSLTTTYTPSITSGSVVLTLTTDNPAGPCPAVTSTLTVTVNAFPTANGVTICEGGTGSLTSSFVCPTLSGITTPARDAGTGADNAAEGTVVWNGPDNITAAGSPFATASLTLLGTSHLLQGSNYGFSIPTNATIQGITVSINRQASGNLVFDNTVRLFKNGALVGTDLSAAATWPTSMTVASFGGAANLWGTTWTPADINNAGFGVGLNATSLATRTLSVDFMRISVTYSAPGSLDWYTVSSGGTLIGSGSPFNPVGVLNSGLPNTNTIGTTTFYVECSNAPGCRTPVDFVISPAPVCSITGPDGPVCPLSSNIFSAPAGMASYAWSLTTANGATITSAANQQDVTVQAGAGCNTSYTLSLTITNAEGCSSTCTKVVTVSDTQAPTGTAPAGTGGHDACANNASTLIPFSAALVQSGYTDNCNGALTFNLTNTQVSGGDCTWTLTYTFEVVDACGNKLEGQTISFTGSDQSAPTGTAPTGTIGINACYIDGTTPPTGAPLFNETEISESYTDCGGVTVTLDNTAVSGGNCGWTLVYSYSVSDGCGNSVQHTITHTGSDQTPPTAPVQAPAFTGINACFVDNATPPQGVPFLTAVPAEVLSQYSDNCGGGVLSNAISLVSITGDNCAWTVTYSFSVKDACGNILPGQTLTYSGSDQTPPTASDPVASFVSGIASVPAADPSVVTDEADNCAAPTVTLFSESNNGGTGCSGDPYIVTRIYRVSDGCNHIDVTHMITAIDDINPTASNPAPINVSCISNVPAADPSVVTDEADDYSTPTVAFLSESDNGGTGCTGSPYILTRTYRVTDACGNFTDVTQTITALDDVNPTASDPAPINVSCINDIPAADPSVVTDEADNCSAPTVALFNESNNGGTGCAGSPYILTRTYRVSDACGNFFDVTQTITVEDNIAPVLSSTPGNVTVSCGVIPPAAIVTATDNCDPFVTVTFSETSDQGADPFLADYYNYTITRTWTATDDCGNQASNTQLITVQDNAAPQLVKGVVNSCYPTAGAAADAVEAATTILDNCAGNETLVIDVTSTTIPGTCNRNLTVTATDPAGNSSSVVYNTIRIDNTPPVIGTQAAPMTVQCGPGNAASLATWLNNHGGAVATDPGCNGILTWTHNFTALSDLCGATGAATVTFTVTDACGMSSTTTATFTVIDTQGPTITTQASGQTVECDGNGNTAALQAWLDNHGGAAANDPCSGVAWTYNITGTTDGCGASSVTTVNFTVTDACGNTSTTTASFTIADTQGPQLSSLPANTTIECDAIPSAETLTATDICGGSATVTFTETSNKGTDEFDCSYYNYTITRTWTATDACGNPTTHTQMITVQDSKAPVITVNGPINLCYPTLNLATSAAFAAITVTDNCATDFITLLSGSVGTCNVRITIIAQDPCGNQAQVIFNARIDNTPPVLNTPASSMTVECGPGNAASLATWLNNHGGATVTDACGGVVWTHDFTALSDGCGATGTATVTFTATDACGNAITTSATFTVVDTQGPQFSIQATGQTVECDGNGNSAELQAWLAGHGGAAASDACGGVVWTNNFTALSDGCGATGTATVTFTATDDCGNASSTTATFTITDTQGPALSSEPADITVDCDVVPSAPAVTATDNCSGSAAVTFTEESTQVLDPGDCGYYTYTITRTWTAEDGCGNQTTHTQTINVMDDSAPVLTKGTIDACYPTAQAAGAAAILATEVSENCTTEEYVFFNATFSGGCNAVVTVSATDPCGNTSTVTYNTRVDNTAPGVTGTLTTLNAQGCSAADAPAAATTAAQLEAMGLAISDICTPDAQLIITYSDASSGSTCPTVVTRTYTITDACGKFTTRTQTININDNTPPSITGSLAPLSVEGCNASAAPAGASSVAALQALGVTVSDACNSNSLTVTYSDGTASGTCPLTFTRTYTVTDGCGNAATVQQIINVSDNTAPDISNCPANVLANTGPGRTTCDAIVNWTEPTATDNCNGALTYSSRSHAPGSVFPVGQTTVTYTFTDNCGNPASCSFVVDVSDNTAPAITNCAPAQTGTVNSSCQAAVPDVTGLITASDNCPGTLTVSQSPAAGTLVGGGVTNIVITVLDQEGNFSQCTTTFTVAGGSGGSLSITCPPDITVDAASGQCSATVNSLGLPTVTGGCGTMTVSNNHPSTLYPLGETIVTWTVTNGTTTRTCTQKVTVVDNLSPSFTTCPANITAAMSTTSCNKSVSVPNPAYSDNCGVTKLTWVMTGATTGSSSSSGINFVGTKTFNGGVTTITYTAKDAAGNQATCSFTVTVQDSKNPTINCPSNINVTTSNGACGRSIGTSNPTYSDNCAVTKLTWIMTGATTGNSPSTGINNVGTKTFNVGVTNITYTAYDAAGNSSSCTFKVTVRESRDPDIDCPADQFLCKKSNNMYTIPEIEASDNCSNAGLTVTYSIIGATWRSGTGPDASGFFNPGVSFIKWTVTDFSGNSDDCWTRVVIRWCNGNDDGIFDDQDDDDDDHGNIIDPKVIGSAKNGTLEINAYPNPSPNFFNLKVKSSTAETVEIRVFNMQGQLVQKERGAAVQVYRLGDKLVNGMYIIEVAQGSKTARIKVIKQ